MGLSKKQFAVPGSFRAGLGELGLSIAMDCGDHGFICFPKVRGLMLLELVLMGPLIRVLIVTCGENLDFMLDIGGWDIMASACDRRMKSLNCQKITEDIVDHYCICFAN